MIDFIKTRYAALGATLGVLLVSAGSAFAEGESAAGTVAIPQELSSVNFSDLIGELAGMVAPAVIAVLGLVAGVWAVQWIWRKVRSTGR